MNFPDADADDIDGATYDAWTGRFTIPTQNIGTALSNYFYTMVHTAYPDTTNLYPPTYFQYEGQTLVLRRVKRSLHAVLSNGSWCRRWL